MQASYNLWLVALSILVAMVVAYTALKLTARVAEAGRSGGRLWLLGGATAMGIWSMHFIGMLAFSVSIPQRPVQVYRSRPRRRRCRHGAGDQRHALHSDGGFEARRRFILFGGASLDHNWLALTIGLVSLAVLGLTLITAVYDAHLVSQIRQDALRLEKVNAALQHGKNLLALATRAAGISSWELDTATQTT